MPNPNQPSPPSLTEHDLMKVWFTASEAHARKVSDPKFDPTAGPIFHVRFGSPQEAQNARHQLYVLRKKLRAQALKSNPSNPVTPFDSFKLIIRPKLNPNLLEVWIEESSISGFMIELPEELRDLASTLPNAGRRKTKPPGG